MKNKKLLFTLIPISLLTACIFLNIQIVRSDNNTINNTNGTLLELGFGAERKERTKKRNKEKINQQKKTIGKKLQAKQDANKEQKELNETSETN